MRTIYHIEFKTGSHDYFLSLAAVFTAYNSTELGISKYTLDRWDWSEPYQNELVTIRKGKAKTRSSVKKAGQ